MMNACPFDAVIFDHDGTLVDTETPDFRACQMLFAHYGLSLSLEYWAEHAVGHMDGYNILFSEIEANNNGANRSQMPAQLKEFWQITSQHVELMPGVVNLLLQLQTAGYPLGVATASDREAVTRWLTHFNLLPYFKVVASGSDVTHNKPAPDVYLFAAQQLGVRPNRCLVFEDSVAGTQAAKAAGMTVAAVPSPITQSLDFSQADIIVENGLEQVTVEWIKNL